MVMAEACSSGDYSCFSGAGKAAISNQPVVTSLRMPSQSLLDVPGRLCSQVTGGPGLQFEPPPQGDRE